MRVHVPEGPETRRVRFEDGYGAPQVDRADLRRGLLNMLRLVLGLSSLLAAFWVGILVEPRLDPAAHQRLFAGLIAAGLFVFAFMMVAIGRDVSDRWISFGRGLGFSPASRRAFLDLGTDRPSLCGLAGRHAARMKLGVTSRGGRGEEWLQLDLDLLGVPGDAWATLEVEPFASDVPSRVRASDPALARRIGEVLARWEDEGPFVSRIRVEEGRLTVRARFYGFDPVDAQRLLVGASELAEVVEKPA